MAREWELTNEEIANAVGHIPACVGGGANIDRVHHHMATQLVACAAQAKLVGWLGKYCTDHQDSYAIVKRADCPHCMDEVRKELEVENG